jgi:hypothetical protein
MVLELVFKCYALCFDGRIRNSSKVKRKINFTVTYVTRLLLMPKTLHSDRGNGNQNKPGSSGNKPEEHS